MSSTWEETGACGRCRSREGCGQDQADTGTLAKRTKVMCQPPNKRDSGPRLGSGTAPDRLKEEEMKLQT